MTDLEKNAREITNDIKDVNDVYLRIWEEQEETIRSRWTHVTFFLGISFAIFGLSLQDKGFAISLVTRIGALAVYWFGYILFSRSSVWSEFLSQFLEEFEKKHFIQYPLQKQWQMYQKKNRVKWPGTKKLLFIFGLLYMIAAIVLMLMGL